MALTLLLIEGFETQGFQRASATGGSQQPTIDTTNIRAGTQGDACMSAVDGNTGYADYLPYEYEGSASSTSKGIGFWLRYGGAGTITVLRVYAGGTGGTQKFEIRLAGASSGRLLVYEGTSTLISSVSAPQIFTDTSWHLVEFWFQDGSNSASWELFVDGTSYQSGTGAAFVASNSDAFRIGQINSVGTPAAKVDDIYYAEATATTDLVSQQGYDGLDIFATTGGTGATHSGVGTLSAGTMQDIQEIPPSDTNTAAFNYDGGSATERLAPDAIATQTNLTGAVTDIDDDPDSPDGLWLTASGSSTLRVTFPTPTGTPRTGANLQNFRVLLRKNATGPSGTNTEDVLPNGLGAGDANLNGTAADIDDDPQSPGGDWRTAQSDNSDSHCHVTFATPANTPATGAGLQTFEIYARLTANGTACTYDVFLYENGTILNGGAAIATGSLTSTTGQLITATWDASLLGTADGSGVECFFDVTKSGGSPAVRTTGEVDAVRWVSAYSATETQPGYEIKLYENGSEVVAAGSATGTLTDAGGDTVVQFQWDATNLGTADGSLVECYVNQTSGADRYIEVGAVEWNADYVTGDPLEYRWIRANGSDRLPGPAGLGLDGVILADCVYHRAQWVASGSGTDSALMRGNSTDSNQLYYGYTLAASYADWFKITSDTRTPLITEYSQAGFGRPAANDTGVRCAESVMMLAYAPTTNNDRSATINQTLAPISQSATGQADYTTGQAAQTLGSLSQAATGTHLKTYTGTVAGTLAPISQSVTGTFEKTYTVTVAQTLSAITQIASGTFLPWSTSGTITQLLPAVMQSGTGTHSPPVFAGTVTQTFAPISQALSGTFLVAYDGPIVQTLAPISQAATGTFLKTYTVTAAQTLAPITQTATGTFLKTYTATAAQTLAPINQSLSGTFTASAFAATAAQTLAPVAQAASGTHLKTYLASALNLLAPINQAASGTFLKTYTASAAQTLAPVSQAATADFTPVGAKIGSIAQTLAPIDQTASGTFAAGTSSGSLAQTLAPIAQVASGTHLKTYSATTTQTLAPVSQTSTATFIPPGTFQATITQTLAAIAQAGTATFAAGSSTATVSQVLAPISQTATGTFAGLVLTATIAQTLKPVSQSATATFFAGTSTGIASQTFPSVSLNLSGSFSPGASVGSALQVLPAISQILTGDHTPVGYQIYQTLAPVSQVVTGTFREGQPEILDQIIWVVPETPSKIWVPKDKITLYR